MSKLHLSFKNFRPELLDATETLFAAKPWGLDDTAKLEAGQAWLDAACSVYDMPPVGLEFDEARFATMYLPSPDDDTAARIVMPRFALIPLFRAFAEHRGDNSAAKAGRNPSGFACSLYYTVRPRMFRRLVRQGKISGVRVRDLYRPETWERIQAARLDPSNPNVLGQLARVNAGEEVVGSDEWIDEEAAAEELVGEANMDRLRALASQDDDDEDADDMVDEPEMVATIPCPDCGGTGGIDGFGGVQIECLTCNGDAVVPAPSVEVPAEAQEPADEMVPEAEVTEDGTVVSETTEGTTSPEEFDRIRSMNRDDLRRYAREAGIVNVSSYTKDELLVRLGASA